LTVRVVSAGSIRVQTLVTLIRLHVPSSLRTLSTAWSPGSALVLPSLLLLPLPSLEFDGSRLSLLLFLLLSGLCRATWLAYR
jgi:hypothetical protein